MRRNKSNSILIGPLYCEDISVTDLVNELSISRRFPKSFFYLNAHCLNLALDDLSFRNTMNCSDITFCDGYGIKMLSYLFCKRCLKNRNTPTDFVDLVYQQIYNFGSKVYFLGGTERSIQGYSAKIDIYFPGIIAGYHHGFYDENKLHQVIEKINDSKPLLLLVGMGMPKQEQFVYQNIQNLNVSNILTVGDLFSWRYDSWRGPRFLTDHGFEWFFRLCRNPMQLWRRYLFDLPALPLKLFFRTIRRL